MLSFLHGIINNLADTIAAGGLVLVFCRGVGNFAQRVCTACQYIFVIVLKKPANLHCMVSSFLKEKTTTFVPASLFCTEAFAHASVMFRHQCSITVPSSVSVPWSQKMTEGEGAALWIHSEMSSDPCAGCHVHNIFCWEMQFNVFEALQKVFLPSCILAQTDDRFVHWKQTPCNSHLAIPTGSVRKLFHLELLGAKWAH